MILLTLFARLCGSIAYELLPARYHNRVELQLSCTEPMTLTLSLSDGRTDGFVNIACYQLAPGTHNIIAPRPISRVSDLLLTVENTPLAPNTILLHQLALYAPFHTQTYSGEAINERYSSQGLTAFGYLPDRTAQATTRPEGALLQLGALDYYAVEDIWIRFAIWLLALVCALAAMCLARFRFGLYQKMLQPFEALFDALTVRKAKILRAVLGGLSVALAYFMTETNLSVPIIMLCWLPMVVWWMAQIKFHSDTLRRLSAHKLYAAACVCLGIWWAGAAFWRWNDIAWLVWLGAIFSGLTAAMSWATLCGVATDFSTSDKKIPAKKPWYHLFAPAAVCLFCWLPWFLAYYPGGISPDSVAVWDQVVNGTLKDMLPIYHTLLVKGLAKLWYNPAVVTVFHMTLCACVFGYADVVLARCGVGRGLRMVALAAVCLFPPIPIMVIMFWKDIPYSAGVVMVTLFTVEICRTNGVWLRRGWPAMAGWAVFLCIMRHNGPTVLLVAPALMIAFRAQWPRALAVAVTAMAAVMLLNGPIASKLPVEHYEILSEAYYFIPLQQTAAILYQQPQLTDEQAALLSRIAPLPDWRAYYDPENIMVKNSPFFDMRYWLENPPLSTWLKLCIQHPVTAWRALLDHDYYMWAIRYDVHQQYEYTLDVAQNALGLRANTKSNVARSILSQVVTALERDGANGLAWRTPVLLMLLCGLYAVWGKWRWWSVLAAILGNMAGLIFTSPAQDYRYLLPTLFCFFPLAVLAVSGICGKREADWREHE